MPIQRVTFRPGINKQVTPTLNEGGWSDGSLVRFKDGMPQPIGGWAAIARGFLGVCRRLHSWVTLTAGSYAALGTHLRLYLCDAGNALYDITPARLSVNLTGPFTTTSGSPIVTVAHTAHAAVSGDYVKFSGASAVGGLTLAGDYLITYVDANHYTVLAASNAGANASGGGTVGALYYLASGAADAGYSAGGWGAGAWNAPGSSWSNSLGAVRTVSPRLWSLDHWGEVLVGCPRGGGLYAWLPVSGTSTRASLIAGAPAYNNVVLTGMPERHLLAFGSTSDGGTAIDPLLIRWSDVEDYTTWTATATNSAGSLRVVGGSEIMQALAGRQEILVWTDLTLWAMRFTGSPYYYGLFQLGATCGLIAANAATVMNGTAYWMGQRQFFTYNGGPVLTVPCTVWDAVFANLNQQQLAKIHCASNYGFNEVSWFFPSAAASEVDSYATLNTVDGTWSAGRLARTAWEDALVAANPHATDTTALYAHEYGNDADGAPLDAYVESGYFDIGAGEEAMFVDLLIPDFADQSGTVNATLKGQAYPNGGQRVKGPFALTSTTTKITPRLRARQMLLRLESSGLGAFWRLGAIRIRVAPDGRKV